MNIYTYTLPSAAHALAVLTYFKNVGFHIPCQSSHPNINHLADFYLTSYPHLAINLNERRINGHQHRVSLLPKTCNVPISFEDIFELHKTKLFAFQFTGLIMTEFKVTKTHVSFGKYEYPIELIQKLVDARNSIE